MTDIKWATLASSDGERTLKQHAFIHAIRKRPWTHEEYNGNRALCNPKAGVFNENEEFVPFEEVDWEPRRDDCCKKCLDASRKLSH